MISAITQPGTSTTVTGYLATTNIYVGAGTAFRAPDTSDRFGFIGNPDLDPEESETIELGVVHQLTENNILSITYFENRIDDLIEPNDTFTRMENIHKAKITGVEVKPARSTRALALRGFGVGAGS